MTKKPKNISLKSIHNKSRSGFYWTKKYLDSDGKKKIARVKAGRLSFREFEKYVGILEKNNLKGKKKRAFSRLYYNSVNNPAKMKNADKKLKHPAVPDDELPKPIKKNYNLEREKSLNSLIRDRNAIMDLSQYEKKETRIIFNLGNKSTLAGLTESQFRAKLYKYMPPSKSSQSKKFLDDIINKWGSEIKND